MLRKRYFLLVELAAGAGLCGLLLFWLWRPQLFDSEAYFDKICYIWLFSMLGLLLGFLTGLWMTLRNLVHKLWKQALGWMLVGGLGLGAGLFFWLVTSVFLLGHMGDPAPAEAARMEAREQHIADGLR